MDEAEDSFEFQDAGVPTDEKEGSLEVDPPPSPPSIFDRFTNAAEDTKRQAQDTDAPTAEELETQRRMQEVDERREG